AVRAGAEIGSNSWGDDTQGRYDISAMEFDALVRDADALTAGDQPYILEFSAGNAGPGPQSIGSPAVAKNVIASGASQNNRFNLPIPEFATYDTGQETMADFSSRGPCEDGRIKPDVVAPGTWIASLRSVFANDEFAWWPISDNYMYQGGTSQSGPQVSGAAAVFVQYWRDTHGSQTPSPAMVKAALINSAVDMDNSVETDPTPNMDEGWGRVDLTQLIGTSRRFESVDQSVLLETGESSETPVLIENLDEPLKITLVYTDVPGFPGAVPALVNDLDLEVIGPDGAVYRGNAFNLGESVPNAPAADRINNVEAVHFMAPLAGEYIVRVVANNVVQDARVDTGDVDQDFALFIAGAIARPGTGIVALDRRSYTAPSQLTVKLFDQDLAGAPTATLQLRSGTESSGETITLQAAGGSGQFEAVVDIETGTATANGKLEVQHDDLIEAVYDDANPAATRIARARADLVPPVISNVDALFQFSRVSVTYATDEDASGEVVYGIGTPNLAVTNRNFDTSQEVLITGVIAGQTYVYAIIAEDRAGNRATNDNGGNYFTFTPSEASGVLVVDDYHDDLFNIPPLSGYTEPLDRLGVSYDVWNTVTDGQVTAGLLSAYRAVIWRVTEVSLGTTWTAPHAQAVTTYLNGGGSLMISSMEFLSRLRDEGFPTFGRDVLGVQAFTEDTGAPTATGVPAEPIGDGIDAVLDYALYEDPFKEGLLIPADASDTLIATTNAAPIFLNGSDIVGVRTPKTGQDQPGRVVFLSFALDAVPLGTGVGNNRTGLLGNILNFLAPQTGVSSLALDRNIYTAPGLVTIEVEDLDMADQGTLTVHASSPQDPAGVDVTLSETPRRGLFRGMLPLVLASSPGGGTELLVLAGDTFTIEYLDVSES
ncbi:MAG: S8 family serine peptidase, partial [Planctomycetota bacterium]